MIIIKVNINTETICCDGGQDGLGHPAVYYTFDQFNKVVCSYCGKIVYKRSKSKNMYKEAWGLKRICPMCSKQYYDLGRTELRMS